MRNPIRLFGCWQLATALLLITLCTGCATAIRGDQQKIKFQTNPTGANVQISVVAKEGAKADPKADAKDTAPGTYATPFEAKLQRNKEYRVIITKAGYQSLAFNMKGRFDGTSFVGAPLPGGSAMMATDRVTGADMAFWTLPVIKLAPLSSPSSQPMEMYQYKNDLLTKDQLDKAIKEEVEAEFMRDRT